MRGKGLNKKISIAIAGLVIGIMAIAALLGAFGVFTEKNGGKVESNLANVNKPEKFAEGISIKENYGDGVVTGEIVVGGSYNNGYCLNHGATLYGGQSILYSSGSAYDWNNSSYSGQIRWLLDNMVRLNLSSNSVSNDEYYWYLGNLQGYLNDYLKNHGREPYTLTSSNLSNTSLFQVQQYALWYYTNNVNGRTIPWWANESSARADVYNALIYWANYYNSDGRRYDSNGSGVASVTYSNNIKMEQSGNDVWIGPISINNSQNKIFKLVYGDFQLNGKTISGDSKVKIYKSDKASTLSKDLYYTYNGNVYIKILNENISEAGKKYTFTGAINAESYTTYASLWQNGTDQPVVTLSRVKNNPTVPTITVTREREVIKGEYNISIEKTDSQGNAINSKLIPDDMFTVKNATKNADGVFGSFSQVGLTKNTSGEFLINGVTIKDKATADIYEIKETNSPTGYDKLDKKLVLIVHKNIINNQKWGIDHVNVYVIDADKDDYTQAYLDDGNQRYYALSIGLDRGNVAEFGQFRVELSSDKTKINVSIKNEAVDLALKKMISQIKKAGTNEFIDVNSVEENGQFNVGRHSGWKVDTSTLEKTTNATYTMNKTPVEVGIGDEVTYSIKIFNEGEVDAMASYITDYLPGGLTVTGVKHVVNGTAEDMAEAQSANVMPAYGYRFNAETAVLEISRRRDNEELIPAYNKSTKEIKYDEFLVTCKVEPGASGVLTNVAEISEYRTAKGRLTADIDSTIANFVFPGHDTEGNINNTSAWRNYANGKQNLLDGGWHDGFVAQDTSLRSKNGNTGDDDDFDKLVVKGNYELVIKKVNESSDDQGIDDIKFNVERINNITGTTENFTDVETEDAEIGYTEQLGSTDNGTITYKIKEIANSDYIQIPGTIQLDLVMQNGKIAKYNFKAGDSTHTGVTSEQDTIGVLVNGIRLTVKVNVDFNNSKVTLQIGNKVTNQSKYAVRIKKVSSSNGAALNGVKFTGTKELNGSLDEEPFEITTDSTGYTENIENTITNSTVTKRDLYKISEIDISSHTGYTKLEKEISVRVTKEALAGTDTYGVKDYYIKCGEDIITVNKNNPEDKITVEQDGVQYTIVAKMETLNDVSGLTIIVPNAPNNPVPVVIKKYSLDAENNHLTDVELDIRNATTGEKISQTRDANGDVNFADSVEASATSASYEIRELNAPKGYDNAYADKYIRLNVTLENGTITSATASVRDEGTNYEDGDLTDETTASVEGGKVVLIMKDPQTTKVIDLALKKIITEVDGKATNSANGYGLPYSRLDSIEVNTAPLQNGEWDADYKLNKTPILVEKGSKVKYQIRIYNEGEEANSTASIIKDYMPKGIKLLNVYYRDEETPLVKDTDYTVSNNTVTINILANKPLIAKYDGGNTLSYDYVTVECEVTDETPIVHTNVAEIAEYEYMQGTERTKTTADRDSQSENWKNPVDGQTSNNENVENTTKSQWVNYAGKEGNTLETGVYKNYVGQQDDDDFEKIIVGKVDLALKKVITKIGTTSVDDLDAKYHRFQNGEIEVQTTLLDWVSSVTTANYQMNKTPIKVAINDEVTYQIRIYNEGTINATASEIKDYIPKGLTFVSASYNGTALTEDQYSINDENVLTIKALKGNLIDAYKSDGNVKYDYVTVVCKVNGAVKGLLTNVAEISEYETENGTRTTDIDSQTIGEGEWKAPEGSNKETLEGKSGSGWARYYDISTSGEFDNYPGQQDDDDFEKILVQTGYRVRLQKLSDVTNSGLSGVEFKINGNTVTTDAEGYIDLGYYELVNPNPASAGSLNQISIEEITAKEGYSNIATYVNSAATADVSHTFYMFFEHATSTNGDVNLIGYYINFKDARPEGDAVYHSLRYKTATFETKDEAGNTVYVIVNVSDDTENVGDELVDIKLTNNLKDSEYLFNIYKVDENGNPLDGTEFKAFSNNKYKGYADTYQTTDGVVALGAHRITKENVDKLDTFEIEEIKVADDYYLLNDKIFVNVRKGVNSEGNGYEVKGIQLACGEVESEFNKEVTIEGVKLQGTKETVKLTAKLEELEGNNAGEEKQVIKLTVENKKKIFDLALRKFIAKVNNEGLEESREPNVIADELANGNSTTADYRHTKEPVEVHVNDTVLYTLRIYNEGERDGYAEVVIDDVPEGVEMISPEDSKVNAEYRWVMYRKAKNGEAAAEADTKEFDGVRYIKTSKAEEAEMIATDYLSYANGNSMMKAGSTENPNLLKAFNSYTMDVPDSRDVVVEYKVKNTAKVGEVIENKAQISEDRDSKGNTGNTLKDRDSTKNRWISSEDDQDIERIIILRDKEFDLSLRKFITKVNDEDLEESREPKVDASKLASGESTTAKYTHPKEESPVLVNPDDVVEYTIRVYNEGEVDGYASVVLDDIPVGVEMIAPDYTADGKANNLNAEYRWVMCRLVRENEDTKGKDTFIYDEKLYVITEVASEAEAIVTDYLSMENGTNNLLKAFDPEVGKMTEANYRDLKVQVKVKNENIKAMSGKLITNHAQIIDDSDSEGRSVTDRDSTTNVWRTGDDDQDYDVIKLGYFDLALYKWVTTAIVTENGKTVEYPSYHTQDDKSKVVDVNIPKDKLNDVVVKFVWQVKVENQGTIEGNALEIKEHIPEGLVFLPEDNKEFGWVAVDDSGRTVTTDYLKDTVLQPGETAEVTIVLTWVNGAENFGEKVNYAEISEDYNHYGWSDIDSKTNNFNKTPREDDEDQDKVMLQIKTGNKVVIAYVVIGLAVLVIIAGGVAGIKKYVLR